MRELSDELSDQPDPTRWFRAKVVGITGDTLALQLSDTSTTEFTDVAHLDSYVPAIDDYVHVISQLRRGMLVLGKSMAPTASNPTFPVVTPVIINSINQATHGPIPGFWEAATLEQETGRTACFFYSSAALAPLRFWSLASMEIELTLVSGGPSEMVLLNNPAASGELDLALEQSHKPPLSQFQLGVPVWVPLPIEWGRVMTLSDIPGAEVPPETVQPLSIGLFSPVYTALYSGTGRLRFTSI